jgi:alpha-L-rhamnosidase
MTTGQTAIIERHLDSLVAYLNSLAAGVKGKGGLAHIRTKYGDWFPPGSDGNGAAGTKPLVSASAFIHDAKIVSEMAGAVGNYTIQKKLELLHDSLAAEFNSIWMHNSSYASGCQTDLAVPLWLGIVPTNNRAAVVETLVKDIESHGYHTTSGILGTRAQYEALAKNGRTDVALAMLNKTDFPSYGFMVDNPLEPATTLWCVFGACGSLIDRCGMLYSHITYVTFMLSDK